MAAKKRRKRRKMRGDGLLVAASLVLAAAVAALWLYFAKMQTGRKPGSDAVFVRRVERFVRKG